MKIKKGDLLTIMFFNIHLKNITMKHITGFCVKKKGRGLNKTITIKSKIRKEIIKKTFIINSPMIFKIIKNKKSV